MHRIKCAKFSCFINKVALTKTIFHQNTDEKNRVNHLISRVLKTMTFSYYVSGI